MCSCQDEGVRIWEQTAVGTAPPKDFFSLSGLERFEHNIAGKVGRWPFFHLTGLWPVEAELGRCTAEMDVTSWFSSARGRLDRSIMVFAADGPFNAAIETTTDAFETAVMAHLDLSFVSDVEQGVVTCTASRRADSPDMGVSVGTVEQNGEPLAVGMAKVARVAIPRGTELNPDWSEPRNPDPWKTRPSGEVIDRFEEKSMSGREILEVQIADGLESPITRFLGIRPVAIQGSSVTTAMPATSWIAGPTGTIYGGAVGLLCAQSLINAAEFEVPPGQFPMLSDLHVAFLRPIHADGQVLHGKAAAVLKTRSRLIADTFIADADERVVTTARATISLAHTAEVSRD